MGGEKPRLRELGEVRCLIVGINLVFEERDKIMRIGGEQRMGVTDRDTLTVEDSESHGF